ncbi:MAG: hypothetical protein HY908_26150 [Myxococcales bacterium]|nr:hypothetical protein [Myxococcales bacterium]
MKLRSLARSLSLSLLVALPLAGAAAGVAGCKKDDVAARIADVKPGPMPDGASWTGVYYSPLFGELHLVQEGSAVTGRWNRPVKDRWGELHGSANGNLLKFDWREIPYGLVTATSEKRGKGYFVYTRPPGDNIDDTFKGEVGKNDDEVGTTWDAIKQRNVKPDIGSIGNASAEDVGGGDWDSHNKQKGTPEKPKPPSSAKPPEL